MGCLLTPFICLSAIGLILSLIVHVSALLGLPSALGESAWALHMGIFVVCLPAALVSRRLTRDFKRKDFRKAALRGCPQWMRWMTYGFLGYAIINFITFIAFSDKGGSGSDTPAAVFRGFSGHWMAFYSAALAVLYSASQVRERDAARRCPNGHPVSPAAQYCEECGERIIDTPELPSEQSGGSTPFP